MHDFQRFLSNPALVDCRHDLTDKFAGQTVWITGAGGYIGAALANSFAASGNVSLILLDASEHNLFEVERRLRNAHPHLSCEAVLGGVENTELLEFAFSRFRPDTIFHAAAFKHVGLLEHNPFAAIRNNALATQTLAQAALRYGCSNFVLVSTDKAAHPHSAMGVSKRIAELLALSLPESGCRINAVRLVNVIGSPGSVVPIFAEQIARHGPVTVTHPEASRYFLSPQETTEAILGAGAAPCNGHVLLPEPGEPVSIAELAQFLIHANGNGSHARTSVQFTGLGPGEKLVEDLIGANENYTGAFAGPLAVVETPKLSPAESVESAKPLVACLASRDRSELIRALLHLVPEYHPSELMLSADPNSKNEAKDSRHYHVACGL